MIPKRLYIKITNGQIDNTFVSERSIIEIDGKKYDFGQSYILPGLVDSHAHIYYLGEKLQSINLEKAESKIECINLVKNIKLKDGWIVGRGWNEEKWKHKDLRKEDLDSISEEFPIILIRVDGHAAWCNSKALEISNVDQNTKNPDGGEIIKKDGLPTGYLIDNAIELVRDNIPPPSKERIKNSIIIAANNCLENGLTEIHDMDVNLDHLEIFKALDENNELPIRVVSYIRGFDDEYIERNIKPYKGKNFEIKGLKFYADGALGSRGAAMLNSYKDKDTKGLFLLDKNVFEAQAELGCKRGFSIVTHAIGDAANRMVLDVYQKLREKGYENILRIEHSQLVSPEDIKRFKDLNVYASVQPIHCISDKKMAIKRLGENYKFAYPWKTLIKNGAVIIAGSDFPIESNNPFTGIDAFVNRIPFNEHNGWQLEETISLSEAIDAYVTNPHAATENFYNRTHLRNGTNSDVTIISNNLDNREKIKSVKVDGVVCNGNISVFK